MLTEYVCLFSIQFLPVHDMQKENLCRTYRNNGLCLAEKNKMCSIVCNIRIDSFVTLINDTQS